MTVLVEISISISPKIFQHSIKSNKFLNSLNQLTQMKNLFTCVRRNDDILPTKADTSTEKSNYSFENNEEDSDNEEIEDLDEAEEESKKIRSDEEIGILQEIIKKRTEIVEHLRGNVKEMSDIEVSLMKRYETEKILLNSLKETNRDKGVLHDEIHIYEKKISTKIENIASIEKDLYELNTIKSKLIKDIDENVKVIILLHRL